MMHPLIGDPVGAENLFMASEDYKKLELSELHISFGLGAQISFRQK